MSTEIWSECPDNDLIRPCICLSPSFNEEIHCYDELGDDNQLSEIMDNLQRSLSAPKHLNCLYLLSTGIQELKENTLKGITFDEINIEWNQKLTTIHENAFIRTENVTKVISISTNPELTFENISIFKFLSKFLNAEEISLIGIAKITEIPTNAFARASDMVNDLSEYDPVLIDDESDPFYKIISRMTLFQVFDLFIFDFIPDDTVNVIPPRSHPSERMSKLKVLNFFYTFTKIHSYAFSSLNNLEKLYFHENKFETIVENAFTFDHASNKPLTIKFLAENINDLGFNEKSLLNINRPTKLILDTVGFPKSGCYLEERIYLPFLLDNPQNTVTIVFNPYTNTCLPGFGSNLSDARNLWFKNQTDLAKRVTYCNGSSENFNC